MSTPRKIPKPIDDTAIRKLWREIARVRKARGDSKGAAQARRNAKALQHKPTPKNGGLYYR